MTVFSNYPVHTHTHTPSYIHTRYSYTIQICTDKWNPLLLKRKVFSTCVFPALTYEAGTWTLTKRIVQKTKQQSTERCMPAITRKDRNILLIKRQANIFDTLS